MQDRWTEFAPGALLPSLTRYRTSRSDGFG
jgi:hypothetical protein